MNRPVIALDLQLITSVEDFAAQLLKRVYRIYPFEKVRQYIRSFRIIPTVSVNPVTNEVDITFQPEPSNLPVLEDVFNIIEKLSSKSKKVIVVFDEFQEAVRIDKTLVTRMQSIIQHHQLVNYVFLGSQESLIKDIFEKKKSAFFHFRMLMQLGKIPEKDFREYLHKNFKLLAAPNTQHTDNYKKVTDDILNFTRCHPYYTQQLAYLVWELINKKNTISDSIDQAISEMIRVHDMNYEQIWNSSNKTAKKIMIGLSHSKLTPLSDAFNRKYQLGATSTAFSSLKKLLETGFIIKGDNGYEIDDPFFSCWIKQRRAS